MLSDLELIFPSRNYLQKERRKEWGGEWGRKERLIWKERKKGNNKNQSQLSQMESALLVHHINAFPVSKGGLNCPLASANGMVIPLKSHCYLGIKCFSFKDKGFL